MKTNFKIKYKTILYFLVLFPFIQQRTMEELPGIISKLYQMGTILASIWIYASALKKMGHLQIKKEIWWFVAFWGVYLVSTMINCPNNIPRVFYNAFILFALVLFIFMYVPNNLEDILEVLAFIYGAFIFLNWFLDILFPHGLYKVTVTTYHTAHLLGDDNAIVYVALPGLIILICNSILKKKKISWFTWFEIAITEYTLIRVWSASAMVVVASFIFLLLYIIYVDKINNKILVGTVLLAIFICLFGLSNPYVQNFIVNVLHKNVTLSNRTIVWAEALEMIKRKPILGYGGYYQLGRFAVSANHTYSSHTPYLQLLIDGGCVLLTVFVVIMSKAFGRMQRAKDNIFIYVFGIGLTCMMINYITEQVRFFHLFIIVALMLHIDAFPQIKRREVVHRNGGN